MQAREPVGLQNEGSKPYNRMSASKIKTWLQCRKKFTERYIFKTPTLVADYFSLGTSCHYALEQANIYLKETKKTSLNKEEIEKFVNMYREHIVGVGEKKQFVPDFSMVQEGEALVTRELETLDPDEVVLESELPFEIELPEGVVIQGVIDKISRIGNRLKITDYKTSRTALSTSEAYADVQMAMYDLAATILFPNFEDREIELNYIRLNKKVGLVIKEESQYQLRMTLKAVHTAMKEYCDNFTESKSIGSVNNLCNWCDYKNTCSDYKSQLVQLGSSFNLPEKFTDEDLHNYYTAVKNTEKELANLKEQLRMHIIERIEENPEKPFTAGGELYYTGNTVRKTYDPNEVAKYLTQSEILEISSISNSKLAKILKNKEKEVAIAVEQSAVMSTTSPSIRTKKIK